MPRLRSQHVIARPVRLWMEEHIMANTPKNSALGLLEGRFGYTAVKTVSKTANPGFATKPSPVRF
jgi:hypothetical protein